MPKILPFLLLLGIALSACQKDKEQLTGHWHIEQRNGKYQAFDITDSLKIERFVFEEGSNIFFPAHFLNKRLYYRYYDSYHEPEEYPILLKSDSLVNIHTEFFAVKRPDCNLKRDYMSEMPVRISLPIADECVPIDVGKYNTAFISMGKPRLYLHAFRHSIYKKDSLLTQVHDIIIPFSEMDNFLDEELDRDKEQRVMEKQREMAVCLNLDKNITLHAIQNVVEKLVAYKPVRKLYIACQDSSPRLIPCTGIEVDKQKLSVALKRKEYSYLSIQEVLENHLKIVQ